MPKALVPAFAKDLVEYFKGSGISMRTELASNQAFNATLEDKFKKAIGEFKTTWVAANVKK